MTLYFSARQLRFFAVLLTLIIMTFVSRSILIRLQQEFGELREDEQPIPPHSFMANPLNVEQARKFKSLFARFEPSTAAPREACHKAPLVPEDRRKDKNKLSVATYNAEFLFQYGGSGALRCPGLKCPWKNAQLAFRHVLDVAKVLVELDADIVHLNEVEGCNILALLLEVLPAGYGYKGYLIPGTDTFTGQNVALLTRIDPVMDLVRSAEREEYPIEGSSCSGKGSGSIGVTKHYVTRIAMKNKNDKELSLVMGGNHFLAFPSSRERCSRREAQAVVMKNFIQSVKQPNDEIILTGDFNDFDNSAPGSNNARAISKVLDVFYEGFPKDSVNLASLVDIEERYSSWHDKNNDCKDDGAIEHSLIDHLLVTPGLRRLVSKTNFYHRYTVSCARRVSDHWPFRAEFDLSKL